MKFWIGGAAKTSNMSIVWAQLIINGNNYGVHAIIVPLRDDTYHKVLPGITIGDCGPKFGLNPIDNGFIEFNQFRVPVGNLLNKVSGINECFKISPKKMVWKSKAEFYITKKETT